MIALIRLDRNEIVQTWEAVPREIALPGVGAVSPVEVGWRGGGELTYEAELDAGTGKPTGAKLAVEGAPRFAIVAVRRAEIPAGKRAAARDYAIEGGAVVESLTLEDVPAAEPGPLETLARRLEAVEGRLAALEGQRALEGLR